ncbi:MAG: hypothetical protein U1B80_05210, partial [Anaerolineaceae bacterium]|nr:hypothetical protein [Anaerolineaceae bacterium]
RGAYWGLALLILPIGFLFLRLPNPTPQPSASSGASHPAGKLLVVLIIAFSLFYGGAEISFSGWVTIFALSSGMGDTAAAAYLTSGFWGAYTLGRLLSIPLATRVSTRAILIADLCGSVLSLLVILAGASSNLLVWVGVLGLGFSMASIFPTMLAFIGQHLHVSGRTTGYLFVSGSLGGMSLPWLIGQLIEPIGARVIPWSVLLALLVSSALLAGILIRAQRGAAASDG